MMKITPTPDQPTDDVRVSVPIEMMKATLPYVFALLIVGIVGYWLIDPAPPKKVVIAVSQQDGNYQAFANLYGVLLQQEGITLEIREAQGPLPSLAALRDPKAGVDMAFMPGGVATLAAGSDVVSLGSLYYEPLWIFYRGKAELIHLSSLQGLRIAIGGANSSTQILAETLLQASGIQTSNTTLLTLGEDAAVSTLSEGKVDAIFLSGTATTPLIEEAARLPNVQLLNLNEAEAYARQYSYLHHLVIPAGALNLTAHLPAQATHVLAPTVALVAREDMHPALVYLVLKTIAHVHGGAGMLQHAHEFPNDQASDFEISSQAAHFYQSGLPFLDRYLPFWAATFVNRVLIIVLPLLALAIPLSRVIPALYTWLIKSRIYKLYGELRFLDLQLRNAQLPVNFTQYAKELDAIENKVNNLRLPIAFTSHLYELRSHIELVRSRLPK